MKRILFAGQSYIVAESRKKLAYLAEHFDLDVSLIVPATWEHESFGRYVFQPARWDTRVTIYPIAIRNNGRPFAFTYALRPLVRAFRKIRPDIVQADQEPGSLALFELGILARRTHAKLVAFTWENLFYHQPGVRHYLEQIELRWLDHLIVGNAASSQVFRDKHYHGPITILPNVGVDPDHFAPRASDKLKARLGLRGRFVVGFVGRLVPEKGCWDLLPAFAQLPADCDLLFLGDGSLREELDMRAEKLGISDRVVFHPTVPHSDVAEYLNCLDCLVLPSRTIPNGWREQFGLVLAQAMACGIPVVGSDSGAIPEVIGDAGLIFPEGDVRTLSDCLLRLKQDSPLRAQLSALGRDRVLAKYTHQRIAEQTYAIYQKLGVRKQ